MLTVTGEAANAFKEMVQQESNAEALVRIFVEGRCGCGAAHFNMSLEDAALQEDQTLDVEGARFLLDPEAAEALGDAELGYSSDPMRRGFSLSNLPKSSTCGCGGH